MAYFAARVRWAGSRDLTGYIPAVICARKMAATACRGRLCPRPGRRPDQRSGAAACRRRLPAPASPARMLPPARQQPDTGHLGQGPGGLLHRPQPGPAARAGCVSGGRPPPAPDRCRPRATAPRCRRIRPVPAPPPPTGPRPPAPPGLARSMPGPRDPPRRAGTRPRADNTIERRLSIIRDLAIFLTTQQGKNGWATASVHDIEAFLATRPASRRSRLTALRHFFTWARASKL